MEARFHCILRVSQRNFTLASQGGYCFVIVDLQEATACTIGKISPILLAAAESVEPIGAASWLAESEE